MKHPLLHWIASLWRLWLGGWKIWLAFWRWWMSLFHFGGMAPPPHEAQQPGRAQPAPRAAEASVQPHSAGPPAVPLTPKKPEADRQAPAPEARPRPRKRVAPAAAAPIGASPDTPVKPRFVAGVFSNAAGQREYKLYQPGGGHAGPLPLLVMLHGCKQNPDDFARGTQMNRLAEVHRCLVLYPAQPESANRYRCWNWFSRADQQRDQGEPAILAGMIRQVLDLQGGDPRRVFVAGLSAGAAMAVVLAHTYPEMLCGIGVHSGVPYAAAHGALSALSLMKRGVPHAGHWPFTMPGSNPAAHGVPMIVFHGDQDKTVHPRNAELLLEQALRETGASLADPPPAPAVEQAQAPRGRRYTRTRYGRASGAVPLEHWLVHGAGHAWSGGDTRGSFTDPQGPNASEAMLQFFLDLPPLPAPAGQSAATLPVAYAN